jgi:hypothetical protein
MSQNRYAAQLNSFQVNLALSSAVAQQGSGAGQSIIREAFYGT